MFRSFVDQEMYTQLEIGTCEAGGERMKLVNPCDGPPCCPVEGVFVITTFKTHQGNVAVGVDGEAYDGFGGLVLWRPSRLRHQA